MSVNFRTSNCLIVIYKSRKRKEICEIMVENHDKKNPKINGKNV